MGDVPQAGSLVYTIWDREGLFLYVGISGRSQGQSSRSKGPMGRLAPPRRAGQAPSGSVLRPAQGAWAVETVRLMIDLHGGGPRQGPGGPVRKADACAPVAGRTIHEAAGAALALSWFLSLCLFRFARGWRPSPAPRIPRQLDLRRIREIFRKRTPSPFALCEPDVMNLSGSHGMGAE